MDWIALHGRGLHSGAACSVHLARAAGPVRFRTPRGFVAREQLVVLRTDRGVQIADPDRSFELDLVEHLCSALGGLGVQRDVVVSTRGAELPIQDGAALEFAHAIAALGVAPSSAPLSVARPGTIAIGDASYVFEPAASTEVSVDVSFEPLAPQSAKWDGTREGYFAAIASARTFGFVAEAERLRASGRAAHVDPDVVIVLDAHGRALPTVRAPRPNELAEHKLLDLIGDSYLFGGPPRGRLSAHRPGHTASHEAFKRALAQGILASTACER